MWTRPVYFYLWNFQHLQIIHKIISLRVKTCYLRIPMEISDTLSKKELWRSFLDHKVISFVMVLRSPILLSQLYFKFDFKISCYGRNQFNAITVVRSKSSINKQLKLSKSTIIENSSSLHSIVLNNQCIWTFIVFECYCRCNWIEKSFNSICLRQLLRR